DEQTFPTKMSINRTTTPLIVQNATESFARTVLALLAEGRPLTDALTTRRLMMTPALMELYAFLDAWQVDDAGKLTDRFKQANPAVSITVKISQGPIPIAETRDPASPNYMHWYDPDLADLTKAGPGCTE